MVTKTFTRDSSKDIILDTTKYISQLSDGTNTYVIKDAEARTSISNKQDTLVSGTNIKTINSTSLLGSGNIDVLTNLATGEDSTSVNGYITQYEKSTSVGKSSGGYKESTSVGYNAMANGQRSVAIGCQASASGTNSIQLGKGSNSESSSLYVATSPSNNWKMLGSDGTIPDDRISSNIARTSSIPTIDQTYSGSSTNAQSGVAVKSAIDAAISSVYKLGGSVAFTSLPTPGSTNEGYVYNVTDAFTTTSSFIEGAGVDYPAGTNVVIVDTGSSTYKFDTLTGAFQPLLVSGTNIKTVNNQSILGSGNIDIQGGADVEAFTVTEVQTIWDSVVPSSFPFIKGSGIASYTINNQTYTSNSSVSLWDGEYTLTVSPSINITGGLQINNTAFGLTSSCSVTVSGSSITFSYYEYTVSGTSSTNFTLTFAGGGSMD